MPKLLKIGIVGCGAIGTSLAQAITSDFPQQAELSGLFDIDAQKAKQLADKFELRKPAALSLEDLINQVDLVIEAARAQSAFEIAKKTLSSGRSIMVMSVGGIIEHCRELENLARENNCRIYIPSGAVCGIDGLKAASRGKINKVMLTTRKPPKGFSGVAYVLEKKVPLDSLTEDTILFEGSASEAIRAFPQNINVCATLSIAGIGPENTRVRIIASPKLDKNIHEVEIESSSGKIFCRTENLVHPENPKTSYLAVLSAIATLKQILEPVKIGT